jgi:hypothetical protein
MRRSNASIVPGRQRRKSNQRGFFDAGLGLALLALFSLATSAIVSNERNSELQQVASCAAKASGADRAETVCDQ